VGDKLGGSELELLSNFLTDHLQGRPLVDVAQLDWSGLGGEVQRYGVMLGQALEELARRSRLTMPTQLVVSGLAEVLRQPEFSDAQHIQAIVRLLEEEQAQLWPLLFEAPPLTPQAGPEDVRVWIGSENPIEPMQGCALVVSSYRRQENALGSVGVLGPTRMVYENAVEVVKATADYLSHTLSPGAEAS
jgi:heat-inducible transcriptional repressor